MNPESIRQVYAILGIALALPVAAAQLSAQARGPLELREQNPLYQLFYVPVMESADVAGVGAWKADVSFAYVNMFEQGRSLTHEILFDMERLGTTITLRYGVVERAEIGARIATQTSGGGVLDPFIQGLHEALRLSNGSREEFPSGAHDVFLRERGGRVLFRALPRGLAFEDLQIFGRLRLSGAAGSPRALTLRATAKLPTASEGLGTGRGAAAASLLGRRSYERWHFHGLIGATHLSPPELLRPLSSDWAVYWGLAAERRLGSRVSGVAQLMGSSRYVGGFGAPELDKVPLLLGLGVAGGGDWKWQVAFVEDVPPNSPSVDFTIHLQLSRVWE